jgi:phage terminase Nu1 subunit (DNA packaging protein)
MKKTSGLEVSTSQFAEAFGITTRRIAQLVEERILVRTSRGTFDLGESVRSYLSYRESKLATKLGAGPLHEAKRRYLEARTKAAELAAEERVGSLVLASQVEASFAAIATAVRSALLSLPRVLAVRLGMVQGVVATEALLREAIEEALTELSATKVTVDGQAS